MKESGVPSTQRSPVVSIATGKACTSCGKASSESFKLLLCGRCKMVGYCSKACQVEHWSTHKSICKVFRTGQVKTRKPTNSTRNDIWDASRKNNVNRITILLKQGVDVNALNINGATPLMVAAEAGNLAAVKKLIDAGADLEVSAVYGVRSSNGVEERISALFAACMGNHMDCAEAIIDAGGNVNRTDLGQDGAYTLLFLLCRKNKKGLKLAKKILKNGLIENLNLGKIDFGISPVYYLVDEDDYDHYDFLKLLLDYGADPNVPTKYDPAHSQLKGVAPLYVAAVRNKVKYCKLLVDSGADIDGKRADLKTTALYGTVCKGNFKVANYLVSAGADIDLLQFDGIENTTLLCKLAECEMVNEMRWCLEQGADVNLGKIEDCTSPLWNACYSENTKVVLKMVELLLKYKADINQPHCGNGTTPIFWCAQRQHVKAIDMLLNNEYMKVHIGNVVTGTGTPMADPEFTAMRKNSQIHALFEVHRNLHGSGYFGDKVMEVERWSVEHYLEVDGRPGRRLEKDKPLNIERKEGWKKRIAILLNEKEKLLDEEGAEKLVEDVQKMREEKP